MRLSDDQRSELERLLTAYAVPRVAWLRYRGADTFELTRLATAASEPFEDVVRFVEGLDAAQFSETVRAITAASKEPRPDTVQVSPTVAAVLSYARELLHDDSPEALEYLEAMADWAASLHTQGKP